MNYEAIMLDKSFYNSPKGLSGELAHLDPDNGYTGSELAGLDAFQRQLKRFDIRVSGPHSSIISKFFSTTDHKILFPEHVTRVVSQGARESSILEDIIASRTDIQSLDYRTIRTDLQDTDYSTPIAEGATIPSTKIVLDDELVSLKKRGRLIRASYEAIKYQRVDIFNVALMQIGNYLAKAQLKDAVEVLLKDLTTADTVTVTEEHLVYRDLLKLWALFEDFEMNVLLASPDMAMEILSVREIKDPAGACFQSTGMLATPMGAKLIKSSAVPKGTVIALDRRFALEMVTAGGVQVEYDKLMDAQLERAAVTITSGFSKIFPQAVKVLVMEEQAGG